MFLVSMPEEDELLLFIKKIKKNQILPMSLYKNAFFYVFVSLFNWNHQ